MKLGLIGAENSHTIGFCEAVNKEKRYEGFEITHVYGADSPEACAKLIEKYGLKECASEEEIIETCDALVITYRRGSQHHAAVMKSMKAGKPTYNDKPFTTCVKQAEEIVEYAKKNNILLCGGSTIKAMAGLGDIAKKIKPGSTVVISYRADPKSEYDGFWFYGIHSVETCVKLLGEDFKSVSAFDNGGVVASVNYGDKKCVIVNTPEASYGLNIAIMADDCSESIAVPNDDTPTAPDEFIGMIKSGVPPYDYSFYVSATKLMAEIIKSAGL